MLSTFIADGSQLLGSVGLGLDWQEALGMSPVSPQTSEGVFCHRCSCLGPTHCILISPSGRGPPLYQLLCPLPSSHALGICSQYFILF